MQKCYTCIVLDERLQERDEMRDRREREREIEKERERERKKMGEREK